MSMYANTATIQKYLQKNWFDTRQSISMFPEQKQNDVISFLRSGAI